MYYQVKGEKGQLDKTGAFLKLLNEKWLDPDDCIIKTFKSFDQTIKDAHPEVPDKKIQGALNNAHGDWYEWLLATVAWNTHIKNKTPYVAVLLPTVRSLDVSHLYVPDIQKIIADLKQKISAKTGVRLITSNPDFAIINTQSLNLNLEKSSAITSPTADDITYLTTLFTRFLSKCNFDDLVGFASVKASFRPDRRLQIPHEGSLMKALYAHIQTRAWTMDAPGLKYYAFAGKVKKADIDALKTVATHSIVTVQSEPQAAVDEVFEVNTMGLAEKIFDKVLRPSA